jgi:hypothetical protein
MRQNGLSHGFGEARPVPVPSLHLPLVRGHGPKENSTRVQRNLNLFLPLEDYRVTEVQ